MMLVQGNLAIASYRGGIIFGLLVVDIENAFQSLVLKGN
jgi:hypothetical protein